MGNELYLKEVEILVRCMTPDILRRGAILELNPLKDEVRLRRYYKAESDNPGVFTGVVSQVYWYVFVAARDMGVVVEMGALRPTMFREYVLSWQAAEILRQCTAERVNG